MFASGQQLGNVFDALVSQSVDELAAMKAEKSLSNPPDSGMDKLLRALWNATLKIDELVTPAPAKESEMPANTTKLERAQYLAAYLAQQLDKAVEAKKAVDAAREAYQAHRRKLCKC